MSKITLGYINGDRHRPLETDLELLLRTRLLIQANSGGGKSYGIRRIAEQTSKKVQTIIIDREGEFPSLREKMDYLWVGRRADGADAEADVRSARLLAERILELGVSAVCDLFEAFRARPLDRRAWVANFLEALLDAPRSMWRDLIIIVDEAHQFCPQENPKAASMQEREIISRCKEAMVALATVGRKRGYCPIWATQRLAKLDKDATAELLNRLVGMTIEDVDVDRAVDLMSVSREDRAKFKLTLRDMPPGNFFAFGRALSNERLLMKFGPVQTTHPEPGAQKKTTEPPPAPAKILHLLPRLEDLPKEVETKAKTEAELRAEIRSLKAQVAQAGKSDLSTKVGKVNQPTTKTVRVEVPVISPALVKRIQADNRRAYDLAEMMRKLAEGASQRADVLRNVLVKAAVFGQPGDKSNEVRVEWRRQVGIPSTATIKTAALATRVDTGNNVRPIRNVEIEPPGDLDKPSRAILSVLAQRPEGCTAGRLLLLAGYRWSGGFRNALGKLRSSGRIEGQNGGIMKITPEGSAAIAGQVEALPIGRELISYWLSHPSFDGAMRKVLQAVLDHPDGLTVDEIMQKTDYSWSGGFRNALGALRTAGVLVGSNKERMKPCEELLEALTG